MVHRKPNPMAQPSTVPVADDMHSTALETTKSVDARKQAEAIFSLNDERQRSLLEIMPTAVFTCDSEGLITYYNQRAAELWGRYPKIGDPEDRFCGSFRIFRKDGSLLPHHECPMGIAVRTGRIARHEEIYILRPDGETVIASVNIDPLYDEAGRQIGAINVFEDITRRKRAEERFYITNQLSEAVNQAEAVDQIYELALDGLTRVLQVERTAILLLDQAGVMRFQAWRGLSDTYRQQVDGHSPWVVNVVEPKPVLIPDVAQADIGSLRQINLDEGIHAVAFIPLVDQGRLLGKFIVYYDHPHAFTEPEIEWTETMARHVAHALHRKQAETRLQRYAHTLEAINQLQLALAAELDLEKLLQLITDAATELSGAQFGAFFYNVQDEEGGSYTLYTVSGVPREAFSHFPMPRATAIFGPTFRGEGVIRLADVTQDPRYGHNSPYAGLPPGHLPICSYLAVPVITREGEVLGGLFFGHEQPGIFTEQAEQLVTGIATQAAITIENARLVAQIKENEAILLEMNATLEQRVEERTGELERSNRELEQFAYVASHDLKSPLRAINQLASWITDDTASILPEASQEHLAKLQGRVQRMEMLLDDLLTFSRAGRQRHTPQAVDVTKLIHNVIEMIAPPPGFVVKITTPLPLLKTESTPLETVFRNLIGNAIKHHHAPAEGWVEIAAQDQGDLMEFRVRDNGPGITPEFHAKVFEMFQTLRPRDQIEGSGIGLALVKKHVESRGGSIQLESNAGEGAIFCFTWPKVQ